MWLYTQTVWVWSPAFHMFLLALPAVISEGRYKSNPLTPAGVAQNKIKMNKKKCNKLNFPPQLFQFAT